MQYYDSSDATNGWREWSKYVLKELDRLNDCYLSLDKSVREISNETSKLKVKSGVWGGIAGVSSVVLFLIFWLLKSKL